MKKCYSVLLGICCLLVSCESKETQPDYTGTYTVSYTQKRYMKGAVYTSNTGVTEIQIKNGSAANRLLFSDKTIGTHEVQLTGNQFSIVNTSPTIQLTGEFIGNEFTYRSTTSYYDNTGVVSSDVQDVIETRGRKQ